MHRRSTGRASVIANTIGRIWLLVANIVMFPIYIKLLGSEQFGIIGILIAVTAIVAVFDLGLTPVFARQFNNHALSESLRFEFFYTSERVYILIVAIIAGITLAAPSTWLETLFNGTPDRSDQFPELLRLIFGVATAQLMLNFYVNALSAIELQVASNAVNISIGVLRSVCVVVPLVFYPSVEVFLWWQFSSTLLGIIFARNYLFKLMITSDETNTKKFNISILIVNLPAIRDSFLLALSATLTMNLDRLLVGRFEGLEKVGQYTITAVFSQLILIAVAPITMATTPRMIRAISTNNTNYFRNLVTTTRTSVGIVASIIFVIFFNHGTELIQYWTGGEVLSDDIDDYAVWLFAGSLALALSSISHCVATANQDYTFGRAYALSVPIIGLAYYWGFATGGAAAGAFAWGCCQLVVAFAYRMWVGRRLLRGNMPQATPWLGLAVGVTAASLAAALIDFSFAYENSFIGMLITMGGELALGLLISYAILLLVGHYTLIDDGLISRIRISYKIFRERY